MMVKDSTTSQLDFLLFEEVSNEAAEIISGGKTLTLGGNQSLEVGLFDGLTMPVDAITSMIESVGTLAGTLGIALPALPTPDFSKIAGTLPDPKSLLPTDDHNG